MNNQEKSVSLVARNETLKQSIEEIKSYDVIGVDLEADGFYRYYEKVCLVQIATPEKIYLIDTLAKIDLAPLKAVLENDAIEKIFHDPNYDIALLKENLAIHPVNIFDTQLAARLIGIQKLGLNYLIDKYFGIYLPKKLKIADWGKRPLPKSWMAYAANDVRYLIELKGLLLEELEAKELLKEKCKQLEDITRKPKVFDSEQYIQLKGAKKLSQEAKAVLKNLYIWREKQAQKEDRSPFMILQPNALISLAQREIRRVEDVKPFLSKKRRKDQKMCENIFNAIQLARNGELFVL